MDFRKLQFTIGVCYKQVYLIYQTQSYVDINCKYEQKMWGEAECKNKDTHLCILISKGVKTYASRKYNSLAMRHM